VRPEEEDDQPPKKGVHDMTVDFTPTPSFIAWATDAITAELHKALPGAVDALERRLWAAAQFEQHQQCGAIADVHGDGVGFLRVDDGHYRQAITAALERLVCWHSGR